MPDPQFNAVKHGCTSRSPVLPGEDESLWREVEHDWFTDYEPQTHTSRSMVAEAALSFWCLARNRHRLEKYELTLPRDPAAWTDEHHNTFARFTRYQTAAQRTFSNAFKNLEYLRKARIAEGTLKRNTELELEKLQHQMACETERLNIAAAKSQLDRERHEANERHRAAAPPKPAPATSSSSSNSKKKKDTFDVAEQWLEITVTDGVTTTEYIPTNEELLEELKKEGVIPKMVYRRMNFPERNPARIHLDQQPRPQNLPQNASRRMVRTLRPLPLRRSRHPAHDLRHLARNHPARSVNSRPTRRPHRHRQSPPSQRAWRRRVLRRNARISRRAPGLRARRTRR